MECAETAFSFRVRGGDLLITGLNKSLATKAAAVSVLTLAQEDKQPGKPKRTEERHQSRELQKKS